MAARIKRCAGAAGHMCAEAAHAPAVRGVLRGSGRTRRHADYDVMARNRLWRPGAPLDPSTDGDISGGWSSGVSTFRYAVTQPTWRAAAGAAIHPVAIVFVRTMRRVACT